MVSAWRAIGAAAENDLRARLVVGNRERTRRATINTISFKTTRRALSERSP